MSYGVFGNQKDLLGEGVYGRVYSTDKGYAIKIIDVDESDYGFSIAFREATVGISCKHPNIISYYYVKWKNMSEIMLVMELAHTNLRKIIRTRDRINSVLILKWTNQILQTLKYLHENKIWHRDIKPDNILITEDNNIKLCDFGISRVGCDKIIPYSTVVCANPYAPPEIIKYKINKGHDGTAYYDHKIDIWSAGITMLEMLVGQDQIIYNESLEKILRRQFTCFGDESIQFDLEKDEEFKEKLYAKLEDCDEKLVKLVFDILIFDSEKRLDAKDILQMDIFHKFIQIDFPRIKIQYDIRIADWRIFQPIVKIGMYQKLLEWLWVVKFAIPINFSSLIEGIHVLSRYLNIKQIDKSILQCVGISALSLVCDIKEYIASKPEDLSYYTNRACRSSSIRKYKKYIADALGYELNYPDIKLDSFYKWQILMASLMLPDIHFRYTLSEIIKMVDNNDEILYEMVENIENKFVKKILNYELKGEIELF